jgi:hypothetical protein
LCRRDKDFQLLGTSGECNLEHSFFDNPDLERIFLGSDNGRKLQRDGKHIRVPLQVQNQLQLEQLDFDMCCSYADGKLHRFACKCTVEHRFKHNSDLERFFVGSVNDRQL